MCIFKKFTLNGNLLLKKGLQLDQMHKPFTDALLGMLVLRNMSSRLYKHVRRYLYDINYLPKLDEIGKTCMNVQLAVGLVVCKGLHSFFSLSYFNIISAISIPHYLQSNHLPWSFNEFDQLCVVCT